MRRTSFTSLLVGFFGISVGSLALAGPGASFQGLGDLPGGSFYSTAYGVSADGSVVVGLSGSASGPEAFRWENNVMTSLSDLPGGSFYSVAVGVSADGSTVVGTSTSASGGREAFRWTRAGGMVGLGDLPGGIFQSFGHGVSADGSIVVGWGISASAPEAFRWLDLNGNGGVDSDEKLDNHPEFGLGDLPGGDFGSVAYGVSADGSIVVGYSTSASGAEAFRWVDLNDNGWVDPDEKLDNHPEFGLGDLPGGGFRSEAYGLSADGSVVVGQSRSASGVSEALRWENHVMTGLGDLPGGTFFSWAVGVSADGSIVVGMGTSASGSEAFIWDAGNGMRNLRDVLVNDFGLDLTDWALTQARAISDDGLTIVGWGINPSGDTEAWIATLPEPDNDDDGVPDDVDDCADSDLSATTVIDGCDTEVANQLFEDGCTMADLIAQCADGAPNHGAFVGCVAHLTNVWKRNGLISGTDKGHIQSCAGQADIP